MKTLLTLLLTSTLLANARAQEALDPSEESAPALTQGEVMALAEADDFDQRVFHDIGEDGALWARGIHWKMRFDGRAATFFPLLGSRQTRHFPHTLSPLGASSGSRPLPIRRDASPTIENDCVEIDRGSFREIYELAPDSVEQMFVFDEIPLDGDLVLWIDTDSELGGTERAEGLEFESELGRVSYSRAVAIDARGERVPLSTRLIGDGIQIRVDAEFLSRAQAPLVIDPVIANFVVDSITGTQYGADVAYDRTYQRWFIVWERWDGGGGDRDVAFKMIDDSGILLNSGYINLDNSDWTFPKCANNNSYDTFFTVCTYHGTSGWLARGRMVNAWDGAVGPVRTLSDTYQGGSFHVNPDVGGDSSTFPFSTFCVVYELIKPGGDSDILYRLVTGNGNVVGSTALPFSAVLLRDAYPSISKSNDGREWVVAFNRKVSGVDQVYAGRIDPAGNITGWPIYVFSASPNAARPRASTLLNGSLRFLVTSITEGDVIVAVMDGYTKLSTINLSRLELGGATSVPLQSEPCIDSDNARFFIAYAEGTAPTRNVIGSAVRINNNGTLTLVETRVHLGVLGTDDYFPSIASKESAGGPIRRFCVPWTSRSTSVSKIRCTIYDRP